MRLWVGSFLVLLLAGCLGGGPRPDPMAQEPDLLGEVPPGCDAERSALAHDATGQVLGAWGGVPCFLATSWGSAEPSLGVTSAGTLFLYPAMQPPTEQLEAAQQFTGMGIARTQDEGDTFTRHTSAVAGAANFHPYTADPFMYVDPYTDRIFMEDLAIPPFNCANLSYSDDDGATWTQTVGGCLVWDHVGYGSGPPTVSQTRDGYPVVIQRCAITLVATTVASYASGCQKSLDGGASWEAPGDPAFLFGQDGLPYVPSTCHGAVHHVFVDHRGWTWLGRAWCDQKPYLALSKDEGATWTRVQLADRPIAGHDVGVGVDSAGLVTVAWVGADDERLYVQTSAGDGATWSDPIAAVPDDVVAAGAFSIAPGGIGKAGLMYVAELASDPGNLHAVIASAYGLGSANPVFLTAVLTTPAEPLVTGGGCAGGFCDGQADFLDGTIGPDGTPWGSFVQNGKLAGGRLWGAPSLWDAWEPDGVYGGWTA